MLSGGCGRSDTITAPASPTPVPATPTPVLAGHTLTGRVLGPLGMTGIGGVRLEILRGPDAGKFAVSDDGAGGGEVGTFVISDLAVGQVNVRASKAGYLDEVKTGAIRADSPLFLMFELMRDVE